MKTTEIGMNRETNKETKVQEGVEEKMTDGIDGSYNDDRVREDKRSAVKENLQSEFKMAFSPARTIPRSPDKVAQEVFLTDIDLTGDEEEFAVPETRKYERGETKEKEKVNYDSESG